MFFDILKRDLKRKKTMNLIILLFVILSVMFISSSVMNLTAMTGSIDSFFDKAGIGDYTVFERCGGTVTVADAVKNAEGVTDFKQEESIFLSSHKFVGRAKKKDSQNANTGMVCCLSHQIQRYFDGSDNEITEVADGEVYVRQSLLDNSNAKVGDKVELTVADVTRTFTVRDTLKDAMLGSSMMGNARFLISENDYKAFEKAEPLEPYLFYISLIDTDDIPSLEKELNACNSIVLFYGDRSWLQFTYILEMVIAGVLLVVSVALIIIAVVILRFTISFTLSEEFRQIGIMKAIGIPDGKIRSLYLVKYLAISVLGATIGLTLSFPFGSMLLKMVSQSIVMENGNSLLLGIICAAAVVCIIVLFCYLSTRKVKKFTPVDAVRSGTTGERYKKKGVIKLGKKPVRPVFFMAVNDILSSPKRFLIMLFTFFVGISMLMVSMNISSTMTSSKMLNWINMAQCDATLVESGTFEKYMVADGREKLNQKISEIESDLSEKGWEADCFVEVTSIVIVAKGDTELKTNGVEGVNMSPDEYMYLEGTAPQNKNEIAMSYVVADRLGVSIGDTVTVKTLDSETECMITAVYQTMMDLGNNIRLYPGKTKSFQKLVWLNDFQIRFHDDLSTGELEKRIEALREMYPDNKVMNAGDYVDYCVGGVGGTIDGVTSLLFPVIILIDILVAVLMEKSFLTKERGEIAMLKAIGFKNRSIILWQTVRIAIVMIAAVLLSVALADPIGKFTTGGVFKMMGAKNIIFDMDILKTFVIYPAIVLATTVFSVFLTALSIRKVNSNEINSVE
ncbi:MAG: ABC transporter permease [Ruminococcus sp.]|nr:ABC transporter permease [Ruminococcus sp.]